MSKMNPHVHDAKARFASRLRASRLRGGYRTARSFAETLNIDENRYSRWERAEVSPDFSMLERICSELQVTPNDLLMVEDLIHEPSDSRANRDDSLARAFQHIDPKKQRV